MTNARILQLEERSLSEVVTRERDGVLMQLDSGDRYRTQRGIVKPLNPE